MENKLKLFNFQDRFTKFGDHLIKQEPIIYITRMDPERIIKNIMKIGKERKKEKEGGYDFRDFEKIIVIGLKIVKTMQEMKITATGEKKWNSV